MDHCTLWLEGWWAHCCAAHDADYAAQVARALADERLAQCVADSLPDLLLQYPALLNLAAANPKLAALILLPAGLVSLGLGRLMWLGVRTFGLRFHNKP